MARNSSTAGGIMKHSRSKMYSRRAQHKRTKTVTKAEKKAAGAVSEKQIGGAKNGGSRKVFPTIHFLSVCYKLFSGRCRQTTKILPNSFHQKKSSRSRSKTIQPTHQIPQI